MSWGRDRLREPALLLTLLFAASIVAVFAICCRPCTTVNLISSNEKSDLLKDISDAWNRTAFVDLRCARVEVTRIESGVAKSALARGWLSTDGPFPDVWSPASSSWTLLLKQDLIDRGRPDLLPPVAGAPPIVQSPLVIAMPETLARVVGWPREVTWSHILDAAVDPTGWSRFGRGDLGAFKFGRTDPRVSTSGLHFLIGAFFAATRREPIEADVDDTAVRDYVRAVERSAIFGRTASAILCELRRNDDRGTPLAYISAIALEEKHVWDYNRGVIVGDCDLRPQGRPKELLFAMYTTQSLLADHPYAVLNAPWVSDEKRRIAEAFRAHLVSPSVQAVFERQAFRDHLGHAGSVIRSAPGLVASGASVAMRPLQPRALERIQRSWDALRRP